jgi:leader peptidase (prepilin peptidase) / N-methyltransferase
VPVIALEAGCAVGCSSVAVALARVGFRQLDEHGQRIGWIVSATIGAGGGIAAAAVEHRVSAGGRWVVLSALLVWAVALGATAGCDAVSQRIPTGLVRTAAATTLVLLILAASLNSDWHRALVALVAAVACYAALMAARVGRGDTRLGFLGALGLGAVGPRGAISGAGTLCLVLLVQVIVTVVRGGDRHSRIAFGPALATGFIVAAASS